MENITRMTAPTVDVLATLLHGPDAMWGLQVIKATGRPAGTIYPILERLERLGWITSSWEAASDRPGPRRRLYEFTPPGAAAARTAVATYAAKHAPAPAARRQGQIA